MVIQSKKVWLADQFVPAAIEVNDGRITAILPYGTKDVDDDYGDKRIVPGFMDIHCHGAYEFDTNDANEDGLRYWAEHIVSEGVTSFLATTITQSVEVLTNAVTNVANVMESGYDGAEILGIHFEAPLFCFLCFVVMLLACPKSPNQIIHRQAHHRAVRALPESGPGPHPLCHAGNGA